jgi:hypothetical protein
MAASTGRSLSPFHPNKAALSCSMSGRPNGEKEAAIASQHQKRINIKHGRFMEKLMCLKHRRFRGVEVKDVAVLRQKTFRCVLDTAITEQKSLRFCLLTCPAVHKFCEDIENTAACWYT